MTIRYQELDELLHAIKATGEVFSATVRLHDELDAVGTQVDVPTELWREAIRAQQQVEACHRQIFDCIRNQTTRH